MNITRTSLSMRDFRLPKPYTCGLLGDGW